MDYKKMVDKQWQEFIDVTGVSIEEFTQQVKYQSDIGRAFATTIRDDLEADYLLFLDKKDDKDKIGDTTLFNVHTALMARSYVDYPTAMFDATIAGVDSCVKNLNAAYKEDHEETDLEIVKYYKNWFKYLFGVGIIARTGWDGEQKNNKFQWIDPRIWVPDPSGDYTNPQGYSFSGFEKMMYKSEMIAMGWKNVDNIALAQTNLNGADATREQDRAVNGEINQDDIIYDPAFEVYFHFCKVYGTDGNVYKACGIFGNSSLEPLAVRLIPRVTPDEIANPDTTTFPLSFYHWKPMINNPYGDRPANKVRDPQRVKALIANLRLKKSKAELYPMYLYNSKYVQNRADLSFGFNKFIAVDTGQDGAVPLDSIVRPMQRDFRADNSYLIDDSLDRQVESSTSIGKIVQGASPERREAATTNDLLQTNTDINLSLNTKIDAWGEKQFVREWLRGYIENFKDADSKFILLNTGLTSIQVQLKERDFLVGLQVKFRIVSTGEIDKKKQSERVALNSMLPILLQSQDIPSVSKLLLLRDMAEANGLSSEKLYSRIPKSVDQTKQEQENEVLMQNEYIPVEVDDDDLTHMMVLQGAGDNAAIQAHQMAHMQQWISKGKPQEQNAQQQAGNQNIMNSLVSQGASQMSAESAKAAQGPSITTL